jgi:hypothetical protein
LCGDPERLYAARANPSASAVASSRSTNCSFFTVGGGHAHLNYIDGLLGSQNVTTFEFQHFSQHNTKKREDNKQTVQRKQSPIQARKTTTDDRRKEHHQTTYLSGTPQPLQLDTTSRSYAVPLSPSIRGSGQLNGD